MDSDKQIYCPKCKRKHWVCSEVEALLVNQVSQPVSPANKRDRKDYMREYMRERRKKCEP